MTTSATLSTERLRLRPVTEADRPLWVRLHTDPAQYPFAPWALARDAAAAGEKLDLALAHWDRHGFGYGVVEDRLSGDPLGVAGVVLGREGAHLNLYYRFDLPHQPWFEIEIDRRPKRRPRPGKLRPIADIPRVIGKFQTRP